MSRRPSARSPRHPSRIPVDRAARPPVRPLARRSHRLVGAAVVALLALAPAACSSDDDASPSTTAPAGSSTTADTSATTPSTASASTLPEPLDDQTAPVSINGLVVDGDALWIASIDGDQLLRVDRESGAILDRIDTGGAGPDDVAVAPDGSVYSTGFESGVLGRVVDGTYSEVATLVPLINGIAVDSEGTVFVATMEAAGKLYRLEAGATEAEVVAEGLDMVNAFVIDEDSGTILAPAGGFEAGWIARIDPADNSVAHLADGLPSVMASTWHPDGRFIALANVTGEVLAVDLGAGTFEVIATVTEGAPFDNLAYAEDGTLYLSSFVAPTVTEVKPDGTVRLIPIGVP